MCVDGPFHRLPHIFSPITQRIFALSFLILQEFQALGREGLHNTTLALDPTFTLDLIHGFKQVSSNLVTKSALDFFGLGQS